MCDTEMCALPDDFSDQLDQIKDSDILDEFQDDENANEESQAEENANADSKQLPSNSAQMQYNNTEDDQIAEQADHPNVQQAYPSIEDLIDQYSKSRQKSVNAHFSWKFSVAFLVYLQFLSPALSFTHLINI